MNEESIWVMDFPNQLISEKVMMEKPSNFDNYTNGVPEGAFFKSELKVFDEYKKHLASRRTFSYPVSKEQDGKEIKESEFRLQHQVQTMFNDVDEWTNCDEWTHDSMPIEEYRRIIAIPIEPETKIKNLKLDLQKFRKANTERAVEGFKTYKNVPLSFWGCAIAGEAGELCNLIKKLDRVKFGGIDAGSSYTAADITPEMIKEEIGGIAIYLDLLASLLNVDLEDAIIETFNSKSEKYGFKQYITPIDQP